jgi:hypothetical protein
MIGIDRGEFCDLSKLNIKTIQIPPTGKFGFSKLYIQVVSKNGFILIFLV